MNHDVYLDRTSSGHMRLTCKTCDKTLVRQPHMSDAKWLAHLLLFKEQHPAVTWKTDQPGYDVNPRYIQP